jgi:carbamoyl-phosphate synthase small subunit
MKDDKAGVLILEDGQEFTGTLFGAPVSAASIRAAQKTAFKDRGYGEVVFNTSLTGYQEILTDPSYFGQIVCMTNPHIGNTGVNIEDPESPHPWCAGFVVYENCEKHSNWRATEGAAGSLEHYLKTHHIPGISGIDTRALTRHLRSTGVVRGLILPIEERALGKALLAELPRFEGRDLIGEVSTPEAYRWNAKEEAKNSPKSSNKFKVVAMDFGVKWNLLRSLAHHGCDIEVVPAKTTAEEILARKPDGIFLSNGPGDPMAAPYTAETVRKLVGKAPIFGVCMGHQVLALAMGAKTYKLKFGHRGGNQPVIDKQTGKVEISSHNHGYAVELGSLPTNIEVTHVNLNDKTVEGLKIKGTDAFSVQYHPEACPGPHDSEILFQRFVETMEAKKEKANQK